MFATMILGKKCEALNKHQRKPETIQEDCPFEQSSWLIVAFYSKLQCRESIPNQKHLNLPNHPTSEVELSAELDFSRVVRRGSLSEVIGLVYV
jgi:hypothetical protein